jgi:adenine/guanine/hypoxanthine permease
MPFTYTVTTGVAAGVVSYVAIKAAQGRAWEIGDFMWGLTAIFLVYFALHATVVKETERCWTSPRN